MGIASYWKLHFEPRVGKNGTSSKVQQCTRRQGIPGTVRLAASCPKDKHASQLRPRLTPELGWMSWPPCTRRFSLQNMLC